MAGLSCGIVGLPNVGKSTLFTVLTRKAALAANYPFCTIDPNVGVVEVQDPRLEALSALSHSKKIIPATVTFVDIAGLVKGASEGQGLGNKFLSNIAETDAIIHVVRCFEDPDVIHVEGKVDPLADIRIINMELILSDLQMIDNVLQKLEKQLKSKKELQSTWDVLKKVSEHLNKEQPIRILSLTEEEKELLRPYPFLTAKKVLYAANVGEDSLPSLENDFVRQVREWAAKEGSAVIPLCAKLEEELTQLTPEEGKEFLNSMGVQDTGLNRLIKASFSLLDQITYITTGDIETRAWTIQKGTPANEAAGKIHSDLQKGFIRAEVVSFEDMIACKGRPGAREQGKARSEGKEYIVQDGDVILFYHH